MELEWPIGESVETQENHKPYLIVDSSFVLYPLLHQHKGSKSFSSICGYLYYLDQGTANVRLPLSIYEEINRKLEPQNYIDNIQKGLNFLRQVKSNYELMTDNEYQMFLFLNQKAKETGLKLSKALHRKELSKQDAFFCAYSLVKSRESDVIAATRDRLIEEVTSENFSIAHRVFLEEDRDNHLFIVEDPLSLDNLLAKKYAPYFFSFEKVNQLLNK